MRPALCVIAILALIGAGCGSESSGDSADGVALTYARGGGFTGIGERLEVFEDGEATLTVHYGTEEYLREFTLSDGFLAELEPRLETAELAAVPPPPESPDCYDCFYYSVEYGGENASFDSGDDPPDSVRTLVAELDQVVEDHFPKSAEPRPG